MHSLDTASVTATATAEETVLANTTVATEGCSALWIPRALTGTSFDLTLAAAGKQLFDGDATATIGYNGPTSGARR